MIQTVTTTWFVCLSLLLAQQTLFASGLPAEGDAKKKAREACEWQVMDDGRLLICGQQVEPPASEEQARQVRTAQSKYGLADPTMPLAMQLEQAGTRQSRPADDTSVKKRSSVSSAQVSDQDLKVVVSTETAPGLMDLLRLIGERHYYELKEGPEAGKLSFGVFADEENARKRRASLAFEGVETRLVSRDEISRQWFGQSDVTESLNDLEATASGELEIPEDVELAALASEVSNPDDSISGFEVPDNLEEPASKPEQDITSVEPLVLSEPLKEPAKELAKEEPIEEKASEATVSLDPLGYILLSVGETDSIVEKMKALGDKDFLKLSRPPYLGRISFGVFSTYKNAFKRQEALANKGVESEVVAREAGVVIMRSDIDVQESDQSLAQSN